MEIDRRARFGGWRGVPDGMLEESHAAHWTPNGGCESVIDKDDVIKFDWVRQGTIIDTFTKTFNDMYDPLLKAVNEATEMGIKRPERRVCAISEAAGSDGPQ